MKGAALRMSTRSRIAGAAALLVSGAVAATVLVESESNDTAGTSDAADPGTNFFGLVNGTISSTTDQDFYSVPLALGERIWVATDTGGTQGAGATSRDTVIDLIDTDGSTVLETDDDDGTGNGGDATAESQAASMISYVAAAAGTYYVRVQGKSGGIVDPYKLFLRRSTDANDVGETETNDTIGAADGPDGGHFSGAITSGEFDVFVVQAHAAGRLLFVGLRADVGFDPSVELLDSAGATLITANSSAVGSAGDPPGESFTYFLPTAGNYFVRIAGVGGSTGGYRLLMGLSAETTFADLSVAIAESADPVMRSGAVNYTVSVSNLSQIVDATGVDVTFDGGTGSVVSASGAGWSCTLGPVSCSRAATLTKNTTDSALTVAMTAPAAAGFLAVSASVSADQADDSPLNNDAAETTTVSAPAGGGGGGGGALDPFMLLVGLAGLGRWALTRRRSAAR